MKKENTNEAGKRIIETIKLVFLEQADNNARMQGIGMTKGNVRKVAVKQIISAFFSLLVFP